MDLNAIYKPKKFEEILLQTKMFLFSLIVFVHQASQSYFSGGDGSEISLFFSHSVCPQCPKFLIQNATDIMRP